MLGEHDLVTVTAPVPEVGLLPGDVGAVVHCYPDSDAYEVEVLDVSGRTKAVVTITGEKLLRLNLQSLVA